MKNLGFLLIGFIFFSALLQSCGGGGEVEQRKTYNYEKADSLSKDYLKELGGVRVNIEQSVKLYKKLQENGVSFDKSIITSSSKGFGTSKQQAIGLGMFASGMSYATTFGQTQTSSEYLKGIFDQASKLGISEAFDQALLEKLSSDDTTINKSLLLTKAYLKATDQLYSNDRAQLVTMMVVGGWIEGIHISVKAMNKKPMNIEVNLGLLDQVLSYNSTVKMLAVFKEDNQEVNEIYEVLLGIQGTINRLSKTKGNFTAEQLEKLDADLTALKAKFS